MTENKKASISRAVLEIEANAAIYIYSYYIHLSGFLIQDACTESLDGQVQGVTTHPPMRVMTIQSLPPSSASSVVIISNRIDLAGLGHRKKSLTLHCFLT